jgi:cytochrome c biogenesis protein
MTMLESVPRASSVSDEADSQVQPKAIQPPEASGADLVRPNAWTGKVKAKKRQAEKVTPSKFIVEMVLSLGSVTNAVALISLTAFFVLLGAWCPQESAVGQEKIIEQFGITTGTNLIKWGVTDLFHTPIFLVDIAFLSISITVASFQKVFPRLAQLKQPLPPLAEASIAKLPVHDHLLLNEFPAQALETFSARLKKMGYKVNIGDGRLTGESGKLGRYAASVTHVGLLSLLLGVTISSWTGYSGFQPVRLGERLSFDSSQHSKLWIGELPKWQVLVQATRREDYPTGQAKQWYSTLAVVSPEGKVLTTQEISVNNPLSYGGCDIYQSTWGMDQVVLSFNGVERALDLRSMGQRYAAFLPLDESTILIFSIKEQDQPLRLFAKRPEWRAPRMITTIKPGEAVTLGTVKVKYVRPVPVTGLQYKCDPGLPITYVAFGFIMLGVSLAAIPHRKIWACARTIQGADGECTALSYGGVSNKAKVGFERIFSRLSESLRQTFSDGKIVSCEELMQLVKDEAPPLEAVPVCAGATNATVSLDS